MIWKLVIVFAVVYLVMSFVLAVVRLDRCERYKRNMMDVPRGDVQYYEKPVIFDVWTTIFYPSIWFIMAWVLWINKGQI